MQFTEYLPDMAALGAELDRLRAIFDAKNPGASHSAYMTKLADLTARRRAGAYLRFGPYWWALKASLRERNYAYDETTEPIVAACYSGRLDDGSIDPDLTIVAAFQFADLYDATFIQGTRQFELFGDGQYYVLMDESMEGLN